MPYQHSSAALSEAPLGALIFPRAPFGSCWLSQLCDNDEQQEFPSAAGRGARRRHSCLLEWILGGFSTRKASWKMGFSTEEVKDGQGEGPVWGCDLPGPSHCLLSSKLVSPCSHRLLALIFLSFGKRCWVQWCSCAFRQRTVLSLGLGVPVNLLEAPFTWPGVQ